MDGLQSFSFLFENLPLWTERLDKLSKQISDRHAEFVAISRSGSGSIGGGSMQRKKTGSTESLRPKDAGDCMAAAPTTMIPSAATPSTPPVRVEINQESRRLFQDYRIQSKRKRKSASAMSAASGTQRFRQRMSLIVYYDSAIQDSFEWLVRKVASARNTLRKGKTSASFKARISGMTMDESPFQGNRTDFSARNSRIARLPRAAGKYVMGGYSPEAFDEADKELEAAQSLCEIGAHQFLREGLCSDELSGTRERFDTLLRIAAEQKTSYEAEEKERVEAEAERQQARQTMSSFSAFHVDSSRGKEYDIAIDLDPLAIDSNQIPIDSDHMAVEVDPPVVDSYNVSVDKVHRASKGGIAIDEMAIDNSVAIDGKEEIENDLFETAIEVDENYDTADLHIDLAAFRASRRR